MEIDAPALTQSPDEHTAGLTTDGSVESSTPRLTVTLTATQDLLQVDRIGLLLLDDVGVLREVASAGPAANSLQLAQERLSTAGEPG